MPHPLQDKMKIFENLPTYSRLAVSWCVGFAVERRLKFNLWKIMV